MDLFRFDPSNPSPTDLKTGELIQGYTSVTWVERYSEPGEFTIEAKLSSGLYDFLPRGTFISHMDTLDFMIVENCEIEQPTDEDPTVTISGRSFLSFLENRVVGVNQARNSSTVSDYVIPYAKASKQAADLITAHVNGASQNAGDKLVDVTASAATDVVSPTSEERILKPGTVYQRLLEILNVDDLGVMVRRQNDFAGGVSTATTLMRVHSGINLSNKIYFSWKSGDLDSLKYLFSEKKIKTSALVIGRYIWVVVDGSQSGYQRRIMMVDADDIDGKLNAPPTGSTLTSMLSAMRTRGNQALKAQSKVTITQSDVSETSQNRFRRDYNIGDLVTLDGNFGQKTVMRISEYAEVEDENGESGHPTLSIPGED